MKKNTKGNEAEVQTATQDAPATIETVRPRTIAEIDASIATMNETELKRLSKLASTPANEIAKTKGQYKAADGKGLTSDVKLAKRSVSGRLVPAYTPERPAVNGVSATHKQETDQLRGRFAQGWGVAVVARVRSAMAKQGGKPLSDAQIDRLLSESDVPKAWQPNGEKQRRRPAYQRVLLVLNEYLSKPTV